MRPTQPLLTTGEVAAALSVDPDTVRRWVKDGKLSAVVLPSGVLRFRAAEVNRILGVEPERIADAGSANPAFLLVPPALLLALVLPYSFALNIAVYLLAIPTCVGLGVGMLRGRRERAAEAVERRESAIAVRRIYGSAR